MVSVERVAMAYNNVYFVEHGDELVVIDAGPDYRGAREALTAALHGRRPSLVIATHGHLDHAGLGHWWQDLAVPVLLDHADLPQALGRSDEDIDLMEGYIHTIGAPPNVDAEVIKGLEQRRRWAHDMRRLASWPPSRDGRWPTALRYEVFEPAPTSGASMPLPCGLKAVSCPGHTPGNLVVVQEEEGWLFSGDQLLPEITPTPAIQFSDGERFSSLPRFLESLRRVESMQHNHGHCFPGHGEPFENVSEVVEANLEQARLRGERLAEVLAAGPGTVYELAERMYPRALKRRFWQIIATIQGHLDVLAEGGRAGVAGRKWSARPDGPAE